MAFPSTQPTNPHVAGVKVGSVQVLLLLTLFAGLCWFGDWGFARNSSPKEARLAVTEKRKCFCSLRTGMGTGRRDDRTVLRLHRYL